MLSRHARSSIEHQIPRMPFRKGNGAEVIRERRLEKLRGEVTRVLGEGQERGLTIAFFRDRIANLRVGEAENATAPANASLTSVLNTLVEEGVLSRAYEGKTPVYTKTES